VWRQDTTRAAEPRAKLSRRGLRWALEGIVCQHLTVARVADGLGVVDVVARLLPSRAVTCILSWAFVPARLGR
jgi:hypothetical protein